MVESRYPRRTMRRLWGPHIVYSATGWRDKQRSSISTVTRVTIPTHYPPANMVVFVALTVWCLFELLCDIVWWLNIIITSTPPHPTASMSQCRWLRAFLSFELDDARLHLGKHERLPSMRGMFRKSPTAVAEWAPQDMQFKTSRRDRPWLMRLLRRMNYCCRGGGTDGFVCFDAAARFLRVYRRIAMGITMLAALLALTCLSSSIDYQDRAAVVSLHVIVRWCSAWMLLVKVERYDIADPKNHFLRLDFERFIRAAVAADNRSLSTSPAAVAADAAAVADDIL